MSGKTAAQGKRARDRANAARQKRQAIHDQWAARHPELARAERAIRKRNAAARRDFGHKVHGTAETHADASRRRQGALARLHAAGDIDVHQLAASQEIAAVHRRIVSDVTIGSVSLEARVDCGRAHDAAFFESLGAVRREVAYTRWRMQAPAPELALAMIVDDIGLAEAARRHGMRNAKAKGSLIAALDLWSSLVGEACRDIDEATLLAAQAGIL